jgi:hypothetical protein
MNMCIHPQEEAPLPWEVIEGPPAPGIFDANGHCVMINKDVDLLSRIVYYANSRAALVKALKLALELLSKVQWIEFHIVLEDDANDTQISYRCPICNQECHKGHTLDCCLDIINELQAALTAAGETK